MCNERHAGTAAVVAAAASGPGDAPWPRLHDAAAVERTTAGRPDPIDAAVPSPPVKPCGIVLPTVRHKRRVNLKRPTSIQTEVRHEASGGEIAVVDVGRGDETAEAGRGVGTSSTANRHSDPTGMAFNDYSADDLTTSVDALTLVSAARPHRIVSNIFQYNYCHSLP